MSVIPFSQVDGRYKAIQAALPASTTESQSTPDPGNENGFVSQSHHRQRFSCFQAYLKSR
jgi:hypothetical protein